MHVRAQTVVDKVADACILAEEAAGPATVRLLRSLSAAVGRMATQPNAEVARGKAAAVVTCLVSLACDYHLSRVTPRAV